MLLDYYVTYYFTYWITPYKLGDGEPALYEHMKISPKVDQKSVLDLPNCPCGANYVVGGGAQEVLEGVVIEHGWATNHRETLS